MTSATLESFMDELTKISATFGSGPNMLAPFRMKSGMGGNIMAGAQSGGIKQSKNPTAKPTNYSIVHSEAPTAAQGITASSSKAVPPPPVRT